MFWFHVNRAQLHLAIAQEFEVMEEGQDEAALTSAFLRADKLFNEKATFLGTPPPVASAVQQIPTMSFLNRRLE